VKDFALLLFPLGIVAAVSCNSKGAAGNTSAVEAVVSPMRALSVTPEQFHWEI
jgi:hypothetical protein